MNLILWRHAQAHDGYPDLARELTRLGRQQSEAMAGWLLPRLPQEREVLVSPALRTRQTADALGLAYRIEPRLSPSADLEDYLAVSGWEDLDALDTQRTVVMVGHQPTLGRLAALLLGGSDQAWSVRKAAIWWLQARERDGRTQVVLRSVVQPEDS